MSDQLTPPDSAELQRKTLFTALVLVSLFLCGIFCIVFLINWVHLGSALLWAFAALSIGLILGFLFAIPRASQKIRTASVAGVTTVLSGTSSPPAQSPSTPSTNQPSDGRGFGLGINTNLEEISDWLTKMFVGIGLVQLKQVPSYVVRLGQYASLSLGPDTEGTAAGMVIYFSGLGFLSSILLTRMFLGPSFLLADKATQSGVDYASNREAISFTKMNSDVTSAVEELVTPGSPSARIQQLTDLLASYLGEYPLNRRLNIVLGNLYAKVKNYPAAIRVLSDFAAQKVRVNQRDADLADAYFNIACFQSIQMTTTADPTVLKTLENEAMASVRQSIAVRPENIDDFRSDPDLSKLRDTDSWKGAFEKQTSTSES